MTHCHCSFSNLFSSNNERDMQMSPTSLMRQSQTVPSLQFSAQTGKVGPSSPMRLANDPARPPRRKDNLHADRPDAGVKAHVRRQDGRLQAYGWSLPSRQPGSAVQLTNSQSTPVKSGPASATVGVPVPVYCRPLEDQEPGMKIWCAAGIDLTGGQTKDGGSMVGSSVFYNDSIEVRISEQQLASDPIQSLATELATSQREREDAEMVERRLSSLVWIISSATGSGIKQISPCFNLKFVCFH